jgi:hypothetical protein
MIKGNPEGYNMGLYWPSEREVKKQITPLQGAMAFGGIALTGVMIGATIGTYVFFGTVTLAGLIVVVESQPWLKRIVVKSNKAIDIAILVGSIYAVATLGVTAAASITIAGLGFTLVYAPYLRSE